VRAAYDFSRLFGLNLEAIAQVENVLNASSVTSVNQIVVDPPIYGSAANYQKPFQAQFGLRFSY
jgi:hypothetical protein